MAQVAIYGAGGLGRMVCDNLRQGEAYWPVAFLDSDPDKHGRNIDGLEVYGGLDSWPDVLALGVENVVVAIGDNATRIRIAELLEQRGARLVSAIHPLVSISPSAKLGRHLLIGARVTICVHAKIGSHTVLSPGCIIEHDNQLGDGVFLAPAVRLAGGVIAEDLVEVGIGACVIPGRRLGQAAQVAPGAVVIRDVAPAARVAGVPATVCPAPDSRFVPDTPITSPAAETAPSVA
ncbi:MAG: acetyltransferase [Phycisphaerae bacterium]|nr:acetyltransferase [Phycisphaerae bacterium]